MAIKFSLFLWIAACLACSSMASYPFCAVRVTDQPFMSEPLPFDNVTVNTDNVFDLTTHMFTAPQSGLYWVAWSAGLVSGLSTNVYLNGVTGLTPNINRNFVDWPSGTPVTTSREHLATLDAGAQLYLSNTNDLYSDQYMQTSFCGFLLNDVSSPLVAFQVGLTTLLLNTFPGDPIYYDATLLDTHNGWDRSRYVYHVPVSGIYVISFITGSLSGYFYQVALYVGDTKMITSECYYTYTSGSMTTGRTIATSLNTGDEISVQIAIGGSGVWSDSNMQTTLMGFLYSPQLFSPVAFSVEAADSGHTEGLQDPITYSDVFINEGSGWNTITNTFTVPVTGVYYIHLATMVDSHRSKMELIVNGEAVANVHHEPWLFDSSGVAYVSLSRSIILHLVQGDTLHTRLPAGYCLSKIFYRETSFSGFLIAAE